MHVLSVEGAHSSVSEAVQAMKEKGVQVESVALDEGTIHIPELKRRIRNETILISLERVMSETGVQLPTRDVRRMVDTFGSSKPLLHVDASQAPFIDSIERTHLGADLLTFDAQKVGGVRGIGALVMGPGISLAPVLYGGGQEQGLRPGTPSPALAISFATALEEVEQGREAFVMRSRKIRTQLLTQLTSSAPHIVVNEGKEHAPHIVNISVLGRDTDYLLALLNEAGFAVSNRSACDTDSTSSRGVLALTHDEKRAAHTLRISWGPQTKDRELTAFGRAFTESVSFIDRHLPK